jgi:hypothetical protein
MKAEVCEAWAVMNRAFEKIIGSFDKAPKREAYTAL